MRYRYTSFFNSMFPVWTQFSTSVNRPDTSFPTVMDAMTFFTASTFTRRSVECSSRRSSCISPFFWVVKKRESDPPPAAELAMMMMVLLFFFGGGGGGGGRFAVGGVAVVAWVDLLWCKK
jgi:hypothetical protein